MVAHSPSTRITPLPAEKFEGVDTDQPRFLPRSRGGIYQDWFDACRGDDRWLLASFDTGGPLSELLMIGNVATRFPEEALAYDPGVGEFRNHDRANGALDYAYREGWQL